MIFNIDKCETALEALRKSMSPDVFVSTHVSSSCLHEEEDKKNQQITMSSLSSSDQWKEILRRFGNPPKREYSIQGRKCKFNEDNEDNEDIGSKRACGNELHEDIMKTPMKTEADQQDADRDEHFKQLADKPPLICAKCGEDLTGHGSITKDGKVYCTKVGCGYPVRGEKGEAQA